MPIVYPSPAARTTISVPITPPAPGRLSTTTGCFHSSASRAASWRERVSTNPPGAYGTIQRTDFAGYARP